MCCTEKKDVLASVAGRQRFFPFCLLLIDRLTDVSSARYTRHRRPVKRQCHTETATKYTSCRGPLIKRKDTLSAGRSFWLHCTLASLWHRGVVTPARQDGEGRTLPLRSPAEGGFSASASPVVHLRLEGRFYHRFDMICCGRRLIRQ